MEFIATFYSHYGAMRFKKLCDYQNWPARMMPVPRNLSSSCGTCVRYTGTSFLPSEAVPGDIEQIVLIGKDGYHVEYKAENS